MAVHVIKQHEINALVKGKKSEVEKHFTKVYQQFQKGELFDGLNRTYRPLDELNGEKLPPESKSPQLGVNVLVKSTMKELIELYDRVATQDQGNQKAIADVVVDEKVLLKEVPAVTILFLQKAVNDLQTFISHMPTPDPAEQWAFDPATGMLATKPSETHRTKKVTEVLVKLQPTPQHPGQAETVQVDKLAGYWSQIKYTTRIPAKEKEELLFRVRKVQDALKVALQKANDVIIQKKHIGYDLLSYIFGDLVEKP